ncbi:MAG: peptide deformylase, partial [OM182 bacterium BACL3 MAG-120531-bin86]
RILVIDVSETKDSPRAYINPTFEVIDEELQDYDEGCLSVPGFYETVSRPRRVIIKAQDEEGTPFELEADGLLAICIQHEIDHLDGKLFVDYISKLKRDRIRSKLTKAHKRTA